MPTLVHIADEKNTARIKRAGIAPSKAFKVVFFMPVVQSHFVSHQWLRELKRSGTKTMAGVYFRLASSETVWAGKYNEKHQQITLGQAIKNLSARADPLGYEIFVERKILPREITRIRHLPQNIGWRYQPDAHGKQPCPCPRCIRGLYGAQSIREKFDPLPPRLPYAMRKAAVIASSNADEVISALWALVDKRRRADPAFLAHLMDSKDVDVQTELASLLSYYRHPNSKSMLLKLHEHKVAEVREAAAESLHQLYPQEFDDPFPGED
jgi:hypothetical protein